MSPHTLGRATRPLPAATFAALVTTALLVVPGAPAHADVVGPSPLRSITGPASGLGIALSAQPTPEGTWVVAGANTLRLFAPEANGNTPPLRTLTGPATGINNPWDVVAGPTGTMYVANSGNNTIAQYSTSAGGNTPPTSTLGGALAQISAPTGIALSSTGEMYVTNAGTNSIAVHASGATGNTAPIRFIQGLNTKLTAPFHGRIVQNRIWVANAGANSVLAFDLNATGNVAPVAEIAGPSTGLATVYGVAGDQYGNIYVANGPRISVFAAGATGNVAPIRVLTGPATTLTTTLDVRVMPDQTVRVSDAAGYLTFAPLVPLNNPPVLPPMLSAPSAVRNLDVSGRKFSKKRVVRWDAPIAGTAPLRYHVEVRKGRRLVKDRSTSRLSMKFKRSSLRSGRLKVTVWASNGVGDGPVSSVRFTVRT